MLGWDAAGIVEKVGPAVTWFKPGDPVYGYCRRHDLQYGTYAEYTTVPEGYLAHMPTELTFEEAGALPLAALTAHQAIERSRAAPGRDFFVPAGAGGVGHFAIQLARERDARVIASASPRNHDFLRELGAEPVDYTQGDVAAQVRELADGDGADAALDIFGGEDSARSSSAACGAAGGWSASPHLPLSSARASRCTTSSCAPAATTSASTSARSCTRAGCARTSRRPSRWSGPPRRTSASSRVTCAASWSSRSSP